MPCFTSQAWDNHTGIAQLCVSVDPSNKTFQDVLIRRGNYAAQEKVYCFSRRVKIYIRQHVKVFALKRQQAAPAHPIRHLVQVRANFTRAVIGCSLEQ